MDSLLQSIGIAVQLQEAHDSLLSLFKDKYEENVKSPKWAIKNMMEITGEDILPCTLKLLEKFVDDGVTCAWLCAAAVDLLNEKRKKDEVVCASI